MSPIIDNLTIVFISIALGLVFTMFMLSDNACPIKKLFGKPC